MNTNRTNEAINGEQQCCFLGKITLTFTPIFHNWQCFSKFNCRSSGYKTTSMLDRQNPCWKYLVTRTVKILQVLLTLGLIFVWPCIIN